MCIRDRNNLCVMIDKIFDSGEGGNNSLVRGDFAVLERDIEIAAYSTLLPETSISLTDFLLSALILIVLSKVEFASFLRLHH